VNKSAINYRKFKAKWLADNITPKSSTAKWNEEKGVFE
jgi:hypothetical protein